MRFDVYGGMSGGFGGASFLGTYECDNEEAALEIGYEQAVEEYQSYEGCHGILSWEECEEAIQETYGDDYTEDDVNDYYSNEIESWIVYYCRPAGTDPEDYIQ